MSSTPSNLPMQTSPATDASTEPLSRRPVRSRYAWILVVVLTLLSAGLHFYHLERPAFWRDEAFVYWRTCGTYAELLQILRNDGFVPLHYELYWVLGQTFGLTPLVMRFVPALAGTLMVPATYFLATQLVRKRAALLAAAFAAVSAYLAYYARDSKMYMHFWLFCTLNVGCMLYWRRGGQCLAWWAWVATGAAMVGLHATGFLLLPLQILMWLTRRGGMWKHHVMFVLGLIIITAGPAGYYLGFNHWRQNVTERGWHASGLDWIGNVSGTDGAMVELTARDFLLGWGLPRSGQFSGGEGTMLWVMTAAPPLLFLTLAVGLFPWPPLLRRRLDDEPAPQPWWRSALWLTAWTALPVYAIYCASVQDPLTPLALLPELPLGSFGSVAVAGVVALAAYGCCASTHRDRLVKTGQLLAVAAAILLLAWGVHRCFWERPPGPLWVTRYLGFAWPAFAIVCSVLLLRLPLLPLRWAAIGLFLTFNLLYGLAPIWTCPRGPVDEVARDVIDAQGNDATTQTCLLNFRGVWGQDMLDTPEGRYYLLVLSGMSVHPEQFLQRNIEYGMTYPRLPFRVLRTSSRDQIVRLMARKPLVRRLLVWDGPAAISPEADDDLLSLLPGWQLAPVRTYRAFDNNGWYQDNYWRRREYMRQGPPASGPATAPAPATWP